MKKSRKRVEDNKPTLIVAKVNGEYHVEMQVAAEDADGNLEQHKPLKYKIASADNEEKIRRRSRKERRLIKERIKEVWSDPFHPEACDKTCLKTFEQSVGILPYDPNKPDCICSDEESLTTESESCSCCEESESDCSSLDLDWEIHFTPPIAYYDPHQDKIKEETL